MSQFHCKTGDKFWMIDYFAEIQIISHSKVQQRPENRETIKSD